MRIPTLAYPVLCAVLAVSACHDEKDASPQNAATGTTATARPALSVAMTRPQLLDWPQTLSAGGNIAAWQEAIISAEQGNLRLTEVRVNVGDKVKKGQVLARLDGETLENDLLEAKASVAEARANLAEAQATHERGRQLRERGFYSPQQGTQTLTAAETAQARLHAAEARLQSAHSRRGKGDIVAPDDGVISARTASVGSVSEAGRELFRLIRGGRLEWRAEVTAAEMPRLRPGFVARLTAPDGSPVEGAVRMVAPTVDPQTRNGLVYVDIPPLTQSGLGAGMFARGEFDLGPRPALTVPQSALVQREGFAYVFRLDAAKTEQAKVIQTKVGTGRFKGDRVEILTGIAADTAIVESGAGFLADGDTVRIVTKP